LTELFRKPLHSVCEESRAGKKVIKKHGKGKESLTSPQPKSRRKMANVIFAESLDISKRIA